MADLGIAGKVRPVLIASREDPDAPRVLFGYVPLTSAHRGSRYEVDLGRQPFLNAPSYANVQGIGSLTKARLIRRMGQLPKTKMAEVKEALRFYYDL